MKYCVTLVVIALTSGVNAQQVVRIVDSTTSIPGVGAPFQQFQIPALEDNVVVFIGRRTTAPINSGVYRGAGGPLTVVADNATPAPGGTGNFTGFGFTSNQPPELSGKSTVFLGQYGPSLLPTGVYLRIGAAAVVRIVDQLMPVPNGNGTTFYQFNSPNVDGNMVVFASFALAQNQRGVYSWENGALSVIADRSTPIPGGIGTFTEFGETGLTNGRVSFTALGAGQQGIYVSDSSGLHVRYDRTTIVPAGNGGMFTVLGRASLNDDGAMAFFGQGGEQEGIYCDVGGTLFKIANHDTPVPGRTGTFNGFGWVSMEDGLVAFVGQYGGGNRGIYTWEGGQLAKVMSQGDHLDGRTIFDINMGPQGLSNRSIAFWVEFTGGAEGIYMATLPSSCYPDCNSDTLLNLSDFGCFQTKFALAQPYADCNGDGVRNLSDFGCFITKFALGCP